MTPRGHCRASISIFCTLEISISQNLFDYKIFYQGIKTEGCSDWPSNESTDPYEEPDMEDNSESTYETENKKLISPDNKTIDLFFRIKAYASKFCGEPCCYNEVTVGSAFRMANGEFQTTKTTVNPDGTETIRGINDEELATELTDIRSVLNNLFGGVGGELPTDFFGPILDSFTLNGYSPSLLNNLRIKDAGENMGKRLLRSLNCVVAETPCLPCVQPYDPYVSMLDTTHRSPQEIAFVTQSPVQWDSVKTMRPQEFNHRDYYDTLS